MKYSVFILFCALSLLFSCAENDIKVPYSNPTGMGVVNGNRKYLSIRIAGLGNNSSRAGEVSGSQLGYDSGDQTDNQVNDGIILIFSLPKNSTLNSSSENFAEFVSKAVLEIGSNTVDNTTDLSRDVSVVAEMENKDFDLENFINFAIVALNVPEGFPIPDEGDLFGDWKYRTCDFMWKTVVSSNTGADGVVTTSEKYYITMTNAPEMKENGDILTLQSIDLSGMSSDKNEAGDGGIFHVQRGAAKVSVYAPNFWNDQEDQNVISEGINKGDIVVFYGFTPENLNTKSYPVQIVEGLDNDFPDIWTTSRFVESTYAFRRLFWSKDPNYYLDEQDAIPMENFKTQPEKLKHLDELDHARGTVGNVWFLENTMEVDAQNHLYSTRIIDRAVYFPFKCILGNYDTFEGEYEDYLESVGLADDPAFKWDPTFEGYPAEWRETQFSGDKTVFNRDREEWMFEKAKEYAKTLKGRRALEDYDESGTNDNYDFITQRSIIMTKDCEKKWFRYQFIDILDDVYCEITGSNQREEFRQIFLDYFTSINGNYYTLYELIPPAVKNHEKSSQIISTFLERLGLESSTRPMTYYKNSIVYYFFLMRHFLDNEGVTWNPSDRYYNGNNAKYLGRYGAVRNNWYNATITKVHGPGDPFVPEIEDMQNDDPGSLYIDVEFKVLSWSKHDINASL